MTKAAQMNVLFVCMGNICRSPTAEGVFKRHVREAGLEDVILSDSAGTADYHVGEAPDARACQAAAARGYDIKHLRGRQVARKDFENFDYVLAMDEQNMRELRRACPPEFVPKLHMFTEFCSRGTCNVPDPYFGGPQGFEIVLDLIEDAAQGLLRHIIKELAA